MGDHDLIQKNGREMVRDLTELCPVMGDPEGKPISENLAALSINLELKLDNPVLIVHWLVNPHKTCNIGSC